MLVGELSSPNPYKKSNKFDLPRSYGANKKRGSNISVEISL